MAKHDSKEGIARPELTKRQVEAIAAGRITLEKLLNQLKGRI
jgi:hypothetical protein